MYEIVGQVPDSKFFTLREEALPIALRANHPDRRSASVHGRHDPVGGIARVRSALRVARAVANLSPLLDADVRPFDDTIRNALLTERLMARLSGFFGSSPP